MKVIECPNSVEIDHVWGEAMPVNNHEALVFLGGGITNCPNWQADAIDLLSGYGDLLVLINPRRSTFDVTNKSDSEFQIKWEHQHLGLAWAILFWFPCETLCPITLYELGAAAASGKTIFVGCHPQYSRKFDVEQQLALERPEVRVHDSLEAVVEDVKSWYALISN